MSKINGSSTESITSVRTGVLIIFGFGMVVALIGAAFGVLADADSRLNTDINDVECKVDDLQKEKVDIVMMDKTLDRIYKQLDRIEKRQLGIPITDQ